MPGFFNQFNLLTMNNQYKKRSHYFFTCKSCGKKSESIGLLNIAITPTMVHKSEMEQKDFIGNHVNISFDTSKCCNNRFWSFKMHVAPIALPAIQANKPDKFFVK